MAIITLKRVCLQFGGPKIFDQIDLKINKGERLCLVGRNGMGKSTLMKVIHQDIAPDSGELIIERGIKIALLPQEPEQERSGTVFDCVAETLGDIGLLLEEYRRRSDALAVTATPEELNAFSDCQAKIDALEGWHLNTKVLTAISQCGLSPETEYASLSGGKKRRAYLARALVHEPDVLLLDEPTNHLDIETIQWLEDFLLRLSCTLVFVTHDRAFLRKLATRILEVDRGLVKSYDCDYDHYLQRREEEAQAEANQQKNFDKKLSQEEAWIRQGIKARRTRNEGRVRALQKLRDARKLRRIKPGRANLTLNEAERSGKVVIEATDVNFHYPGQKDIIQSFAATVLRGDKIGLIGPNGVGKTTLLNLLLGSLTPSSGTVKHGSNLIITYFDQMRSQLNPSESIRENVSPGTDTLQIGDKKKHVVSYLNDFLFSSDRIHTPVKALSGGEKNRVMLAKCFAEPSNLMVLDEPTNDLDIETLELLEELCVSYSGTLLLVSHDRAFLNNVVTSTIAYDRPGCFNEYVGGYDDWLRQQPETVRQALSLKPSASIKATPIKQKKSFNEQRELAQVVKQIEELEAQQSAIHDALADGTLYQANHQKALQLNEELSNLASTLESLYERWSELEES